MEQIKIFDSHHIGYGRKAYFRHCLNALRYALILQGTALIVFVHAFLPFFLTNVGSLSVKRLNDEMQCKD